MLFFVIAPYGRHFRRGWGPTINNKMGWIVMEAAAPVIFATCFVLGNNTNTVAMGMVERNGKAIAKVVPDVKARTLLPMIVERIAREDKTIVFTDDLPSYNQVERLGYAHKIVQHAAKQYVSGIAHVNTVESLWSTIKRGIDGVNHSVSPLYLQSYLDSYIYRYNHRKDEQPMFLSLLNQVSQVVRIS